MGGNKKQFSNWCHVCIVLSLTAVFFGAGYLLFDVYNQQILSKSSRAESDGSIVVQTIALPEGVSSGFLTEAVLDLSNSVNYTDAEYAIELAKWREVNKNVCAIIAIPELSLLEPVLSSPEGNKQWLRTNIYGVSDTAGAVFLDSRCDISTSIVKIIHGHNMKNGRMFASVPQYLRYESCAEAPSIYLTTDAGTTQYDVFAVLSVNSKEESFPVNVLATVEDVSASIDECIERSVVLPRDPTSVDLLLLNTCWYGVSGTEHNLHCVVVASRNSIVD